MSQVAQVAQGESAPGDARQQRKALNIMESTDMTYDDLRTQMIAAARLLFATDVMSHSGHANMSVRLPEPDRLLMTARGQVRDLAAEQLAVVTLTGEVVEGDVDATNREIIAMHAAVYRERPEARAVIHTHSPHVTSFALAHQPLPCRYEALLRFGIAEDIPVAAWGPRGSEESIRAIRETLQAHPGVPAVLLANHGLLAFGTEIGAAAQLIVAMEEAAEMTLGAMAVGGPQPFPEGALEQVHAHIARFA